MAGDLLKQLPLHRRDLKCLAACIRFAETSTSAENLMKKVAAYDALTLHGRGTRPCTDVVERHSYGRNSRRLSCMRITSGRERNRPVAHHLTGRLQISAAGLEPATFGSGDLVVRCLKHRREPQRNHHLNHQLNSFHNPNSDTHHRCNRVVYREITVAAACKLR